MYGVIPVHRGDYDRPLLTKIISIIKSGIPLLIAPEGGRSHDTAMGGPSRIAYIVEQTGAPVLAGWSGRDDRGFLAAGSRGKNHLLKCALENPLHSLTSLPKGRKNMHCVSGTQNVVMSYWLAYCQRNIGCNADRRSPLL
jgi:1-acyl-sn-glycerol-3-phosphate acyltransferase